MNADRKRVGSDGGIIQWSDEVTGREPFDRWRGPSTPGLRVTVETIQASARYMLRRLTERHVAVRDALRRRGERP